MDPNYALAYSGLSHAYCFWGDFYSVFHLDMLQTDIISFRLENHANPDKALEKALTLDPNLAEAHTHLGFNKRYRYDFRGAEKEF